MAEHEWTLNSNLFKKFWQVIFSIGKICVLSSISCPWKANKQGFMPFCCPYILLTNLMEMGLCITTWAGSNFYHWVICLHVYLVIMAVKPLPHYEGFYPEDIITLSKGLCLYPCMLQSSFQVRDWREKKWRTSTIAENMAYNY